MSPGARRLNGRLWQEPGRGRFWYDGMINGFYMQPNVPGLRRDDDSHVQGFERATVGDFSAFRSLVLGIMLTDAALLI